VNAEIKAVIRQAMRLGLVVEHGGKHPRIRDPKSGRAIVISGTPRCPHAHKNVIRDLRKYLGVTIT
jgi:hypothetical protein